MRSLKVENFSCIESASLNLSRVTILIGPQASGKSVLCKLTYFFIYVLQEQAQFIAAQRSFDTFKEYIKGLFCEWFPPSAWGNKKFTISFIAGDYELRLSRTMFRKTKEVTVNFRLSASHAFQAQYNETVSKIQELTKKHKDAPNRGLDFEYDWRLQEISTRSIIKLLGKDQVASQLFVPAGRSFFTSIGKAVAAFEQGRVLDPLIIQFGRIFTAYKDYRFGYSAMHSQNAQVSKAMSEIFGGEFKRDGEREYVLAPDGREIPLSALSSGQQELLPLLTVIPMLIPRIRERSMRSTLVYIEEPEAHLFPMAQSKLVEVMASLVNHSGKALDMVITTHSPYVLAKLNNLIKAGRLAKKNRASLKDKVAKVVPQNAWLTEKYVTAYAIKDGVLLNIMDADGMIDAEYLDDVSGDIEKEFSKLLEVEYSG